MAQKRNDIQSSIYCCHGLDLTLADRLGAAVALVDRHRNIAAISDPARTLLRGRRGLRIHDGCIDVPSPPRRRELDQALSRALASGTNGAVRINEASQSGLLVVHVSPWGCPEHCLLRLHLPHPQPRDLSFLADALELSDRQVEMLEHFSGGMPLARIAKEVGLKPQTVRESFTQIYARMQLGNQLELMSALTALSGADMGGSGPGDKVHQHFQP